VISIAQDDEIVAEQTNQTIQMSKEFVIINPETLRKMAGRGSMKNLILHYLGS
jgi:hypothetical protein